MSEVRVLIIDDAAATRRMLAEALADDPGLKLVGSAANGPIGLVMASVVKPDVVVLDLVMPDMDGFQVLAALRVAHPKLPVVVLSGSTRRGSRATLDALALGAADYVTKPSSLDGPGAAARMIAGELAPKLKALGARANMPEAGSRVRERPDRSARRPEVVVVAASTGGPDALGLLLAAIPADFPAPILIVQHMPPAFTGPLARRLDSLSPLAISEAVDGQVVRPGRAVVAPGDWHLVGSRVGDEVRASTHRGPPENSCRPSADVLFRSAAAAFGAGTLGVVMTGMGQDGLLGAEEVRRLGGMILAQDQESSVVWGMPGYVVRAGLADRVLPPDQLAAEIVRRTRGEPALGRRPA